MKREDYKNNVWYNVVDEAYWVEEYPDEFPNCFSIVCETNCYGEQYIYTQRHCYLGWGAMAKHGGFKFMIIEKPYLKEA